MKSAMRSYANETMIQRHIKRLESVYDIYNIPEKLKDEAVEALKDAAPEYLCNILKYPFFTLKELEMLDKVLSM